MKTTRIDQKQARKQMDKKKNQIKSKTKKKSKNQYHNCGIAYIITRIESTCISKVVLYKYNTWQQKVDTKETRTRWLILHQVQNQANQSIMVEIRKVLVWSDWGVDVYVSMFKLWKLIKLPTSCVYVLVYRCVIAFNKNLQRRKSREERNRERRAREGEREGERGRKGGMDGERQRKVCKRKDNLFIG